ncbi:MAG: hypothetical protein CL677_07715 [Bdellovibrionaceae bacterium]|nr:hypothetical protein [Pseudobdellovibrionaceae bacterium]|tara:strand:+ start:29750 stop:30358 length:609 start_codon:yes stop_codon:yes gene_type:complete
MKANSQGKRTKGKLIKVALRCFSEHGVHNVTLQMVAKESKIERSLVTYYFKDTVELFKGVWDFVYNKALEATIQKQKASKTAKEEILNYIQVSYEVFLSDKSIPKLYAQLFYLAAFHPEILNINTNVKRVAVTRIAKIIMRGQSEEIFDRSLDPYLTAKTIHIGLTGVLLNYTSEIQEFDYGKIVDNYSKTILTSIQSVQVD